MQKAESSVWCIGQLFQYAILTIPLRQTGVANLFSWNTGQRVLLSAHLRIDSQFEPLM